MNVAPLVFFLFPNALICIIAGAPRRFRSNHYWTGEYLVFYLSRLARSYWYEVALSRVENPTVEGHIVPTCLRTVLSERSDSRGQRYRKHPTSKLKGSNPWRVRWVEPQWECQPGDNRDNSKKEDDSGGDSATWISTREARQRSPSCKNHPPSPSWQSYENANYRLRKAATIWRIWLKESQFEYDGIVLERDTAFRITCESSYQSHIQHSMLFTTFDASKHTTCFRKLRELTHKLCSSSSPSNSE